MAKLINTADWRLNVLYHSIGIPYYYSGGTLSEAIWPPPMVDCSGYYQAAAYAINILRKDAWHDKTANGIANACDAVYVPDKKGKWWDCEIGDAALYGKPGKITHVMMCLGGGMVIGATGGGVKTKGDDLTACVKVVDMFYRNDLVVVGRIKPEYRP